MPQSQCPACGAEYRPVLKHGEREIDLRRLCLYDEICLRHTGAQNERSTDEHKTARMQPNSAPGGAWPADLHVLTFLARYFLPVGANRYADTCEGIGGERWAHQDPCDQVGTRFGHHLVWVGSVRAVPG